MVHLDGDFIDLETLFHFTNKTLDEKLKAVDQQTLKELVDKKFVTQNVIYIGEDEVVYIVNNKQLHKALELLASTDDTSSEPILAEIVGYLNSKMFSLLLEIYPNYKDSLHLINHAVKVVDVNKPSTEMGDLFERIGNYYRYIERDYARALDFYHKLVRVRRSVDRNDNENLARALNLIAHVYNFLDKSDDGLKYSMDAFEMYKRIYKDVDNEGFVRSYNSLGINYFSLNKLDEALKYHLLALEMINRLYKTDTKYKGIALNNIGLALFSMKKFSDSLEYFLCSFKISTKVFDIDHFLIVATLKMIGIAYFTLNDYRKSLEYYLLEVSMNKRLNKVKDKDTSWSYYFIGMAYYNLKDYKSAYSYFSMCIEIESELYKKNEKTFTNQELFNELLELTMNCARSLNMYEKCDELNKKKFRTKQEEYNQSIAEALRMKLSSVKHSVTCSIV